MKRLFPSLNELQRFIKNSRSNRYVFKVFIYDILELYKELEKKCSKKIRGKVNALRRKNIKRITPEMVLDGLNLDKFNPDKIEIYKMSLGKFYLNKISHKYDTGILKMENHSSVPELYLRDDPNDVNDDNKR